MSFFANPDFYLQTAEGDIVKFFKAAEAGVEHAAQDFINVLGWVQSNAGEIAGFLAALLGTATSAAGGPIAIPATLISGANLLNEGMQLLNSAVTAAQQNASGTATQQAVAALAAAYSKFKEVQAATASAASVTTTPAAAHA